MVVIRLATSDDLPAIRELIPRSVRELSGSRYTAQQIESSIQHIFGLDTQLIADGTYFAAADGERLVGCGGWSRRRTLYGGDQMKSAADPLLDPAREAARIRAFYVAPDRARQGIGRQILEACVTAAAAAGFQDLELIATLPGEPLYAACGFVAQERFDAPLPQGLTLPVVRMRRPIRLGPGLEPPRR